MSGDLGKFKRRWVAILIVDVVNVGESNRVGNGCNFAGVQSA